METAEKSKEATSSEFKLSFSGTSGCQYGYMVYKCRSPLNAGLVLTLGSKVREGINAGAYIRECTVHVIILSSTRHRFINQSPNAPHRPGKVSSDPKIRQ